MTRFDRTMGRIRSDIAGAWSRARTRLRYSDWRLSPQARRRWFQGAGVGAGALAALVLALGLADWNYLKGPVEALLSARTGRPVHIDGDLQVHILSLNPSAKLEGLRIGNPRWAGPDDMARIQRLTVKVKLMPLFRGRVILPLLDVDHPNFDLVRDEQGRANWTFGKRGKPISLPPIRQFQIRDGDLSIRDAKRRLDFKGVVNSSQIMGGKTVQAFQLTGDGTLNSKPFDLALTGGPLLNVDPRKPYPFDGRLSAGDTRIAAKGAIARPFDFGTFDTSLAISGPDLAQVYYLTGLALPNTPPYDVSGHLARRGLIYDYTGLNGRVGDSDLHGDLRVRTGGERLFLGGALSSKRLVFKDLATLLGGGAATSAGSNASPTQAQKARELAARDRIFPDTPLRVERLRSMDAKVSYAADSISAVHFPVRSGSVDLSLDRGLLTLSPVAFGLTNGRLSGEASINARAETPSVAMDLRLSGARIDEFIPASYAGAASGALLGRLKLSSRGASVREAAAGANGQFTIVVPKGEMRESLAELLGVDVLRGLFANPEKKTDLRCAVADFKVTNGVMRAQTFVLDTGPVIATGGGTVNLKSENLDLHIKGHPKEARLVRLAIPLQLTGPLRKPDFGVETDTAAAQGIGAVVLGALIAPLAAILPFVDPGLAEDANCRGLVAQAGTGHPAPVEKTAERAAADAAG